MKRNMDVAQQDRLTLQLRGDQENRMTDPTNPFIPPDCWPARMNAHMAAAYVGERSAAQFLARVGPEYPLPIIDDGMGKGRRQLWLKHDLDKAIGNWVEGNVNPPVVDF